MKQFFTFRYRYNNVSNTQSVDRTSPAEIFRLAYPEYSGIVFIEDSITPDSVMVPGLNGEIPGLRLGYAEFQESIVDPATVSDELANNGQVRIYPQTPAQAIEFLRKQTTIPEREPGVFVLSEAYEMDGVQYPEKLLTIE